MKENLAIPATYDELKTAYLDLFNNYETCQKNFADISSKFTDISGKFTNISGKYDLLRDEVAWMKKQLFGHKSERYVPLNNGQLALTLGLPGNSAPVSKTEKISYERIVPQKPEDQKNGHGRSPLPAHLRRVDVVIEPKEDVSGMVKIGEEITEELEYTPPVYVVNRFIRPKYGKANGDGSVAVAELPARAIEKGRPGPGLIAHVVVSKFVDHLPFYRQSKIFAREGIDISRSTLYGWQAAICNQFVPVVEALKQVVFTGNYLQVDETPILILEGRDEVLEQQKKLTKQTKTHRGFFWPYLNPVCRAVFFDFQDGRGRAGPGDIIQGYTGIIQTDGYAVYDSLSKQRAASGGPPLVCAACLAHIRRKFKEALSNHQSQAEQAMAYISSLYDIERGARERKLTSDERYAFRLEYGAPKIMEAFKAWLDDLAYTPDLLPGSLIGKAVNHALKRWNALQVYLTDGRMEIDNNLVENAIRPIALGRKNWLFCGSSEGAERAALIYSLVGTCQLNGLEPYAYLKNLIENLPTHPQSRINELLPLK
jgi:transposase